MVNIEQIKGIVEAGEFWASDFGIDGGSIMNLKAEGNIIFTGETRVETIILASGRELEVKTKKWIVAPEYALLIMDIFKI